MDLELIAQGDGWLAINKPIGIGMHTEGEQLGLVVLAEQYFKQPLWPVHRLDNVTSGILLLATDQQAASELSALFSEQRIEKFYLAQSSQRPKKKQGWIKGDMAKGRNGSWLLKRSMNNPAITRFTTHFDDHQSKRLFLLQPLTGKTHQLRVAMKSLGSPIDGDKRYSGQEADRAYLHAYALRWQMDEQSIEIICPPSVDWCAVPVTWQTPWTLFS